MGGTVWGTKDGSIGSPACERCCGRVGVRLVAGREHIDCQDAALAACFDPHRVASPSADKRGWREHGGTATRPAPRVRATTPVYRSRRSVRSARRSRGFARWRDDQQSAGLLRRPPRNRRFLAMHGGLRLSPTAGTYHCSPNGWLPRFTVTVIEFLSGSMVLASDVRLFILIGMVLLLFRPFVYFPFRPERTSTSAAARRPPPRPPPARSPQATPARPGAGLRRIPLPGRPLTRMCSGRRGDAGALTDSATDCRSSQLSDRLLVARCWCVCGDEDHRAAAVVDQVRGRFADSDTSGYARVRERQVDDRA
ncbi:hypothetical protein SAMN04490239_9333 [Rhodococcus koreensis]|uniref:Uncharacterized protein n=1 Tax=Rhodococcus koreensis TaxID=99653 RepID=A0A1H5ESH8_9NOCA|nr:hypothetical protein SAMN04490239_9333 [Rhodococcus koreensis]